MFHLNFARRHYPQQPANPIYYRYYDLFRDTCHSRVLMTMIGPSRDSMTGVTARSQPSIQAERSSLNANVQTVLSRDATSPRAIKTAKMDEDKFVQLIVFLFLFSLLLHAVILLRVKRETLRRKETGSMLRVVRPSVAPTGASNLGDGKLQAVLTAGYAQRRAQTVRFIHVEESFERIVVYIRRRKSIREGAKNEEGEELRANKESNNRGKTVQQKGGMMKSF
ncbi:hypothetical protein OUZ56_001661 [Daphnia magna]|uniref:Transmembrane protein n=1 Tax=Daphnia magna TaxID=35525 RepID=A0ABR0A3C6_9CRUS|nr:hypothetical protein OUZ56_001661 [Daphnia magna]